MTKLCLISTRETPLCVCVRARFILDSWSTQAAAGKALWRSHRFCEQWVCGLAHDSLPNATPTALPLTERMTAPSFSVFSIRICVKCLLVMQNSANRVGCLAGPSAAQTCLPRSRAYSDFQAGHQHCLSSHSTCPWMSAESYFSCPLDH